MDLRQLSIWIINSHLHYLEDLAESKKSHEEEGNERYDVPQYHSWHLNQEQESVINPDEIYDFIESLQDNETLKEKLNDAIALELCDHLGNVKEYEENKLAGVN